MRNSIKIEAQLEAQRFTAQQAARAVATLDVLSVYYTIKAKIEAGEIEAARQLWIDYKKGT
jgi:hypothetical protein